ncbi:MAG: hypothetical protein LW852_02720, partial [Sediminibacterium sp.]|nr:hypothetical protein [Sediminibacterium sp.]
TLLNERLTGGDRLVDSRSDRNESIKSNEGREDDLSFSKFDTTRSSKLHDSERPTKAFRNMDKRVFPDENSQAPRDSSSMGSREFNKRLGRKTIGDEGTALNDSHSSLATQKIERRKKLNHERTIALDRKKVNLEVTDDSLLYDSLGCNPMSCQSQALAAVEDGDLVNAAAKQFGGAWCTDDVCSASLTDFADSMKGIFEQHESYKEGIRAASQKPRAIAERYLSDFLSDSVPMSELLSVKDLWNATATQHITGKVIRKRQILSRSINADGKAIHLNNLRTQMTFQGANAVKKMTYLQTTSSFDDINRCGKWDAKSRALQIAGQFDSSGFLDLEKNVNGREEREGCEVLYYDSDPEGSRERTLKRGPRRAIAERKNSIDQSTCVRREALDILNLNRYGIGRRWRRYGDELVLDVIEVRLSKLIKAISDCAKSPHDIIDSEYKFKATKNEKFILMWHPSQTDENNVLPTVICVKLWVEAGVYLGDGTFLLPKLTWLPVHENKLFARVLNVTEDSPGSLDLLDVCRVKECDAIDRNSYPFAHVDRSFVIQTQGRNHLFETQTTQERGRVVNGLKLVIARLASLLMLRDLRAVDEFFGGNHNSVPGEAPAWARAEKSESSPIG